MQVMFVWYHYFAAKEWYNWIRIYIACYVWMTGFGIESITIVGVFLADVGLTSSMVASYSTKGLVLWLGRI